MRYAPRITLVEGNPVVAFRMFCALALAFTGLTAASPALAQSIKENITAADPDAVASVIREKGFEVTLSKDDDGDPMIRAEGRGYTFTVFFYGCTENRDCTTLGFNSYFADGTSDIAKVNGWNRENRFGRAYVDGDGDPVIEMDVDLDDGGMSPLLFEDHVEFWMSVMTQFAKFAMED